MKGKRGRSKIGQEKFFRLVLISLCESEGGGTKTGQETLSYTTDLKISANSLRNLEGRLVWSRNIQAPVQLRHSIIG